MLSPAEQLQSPGHHMRGVESKFVHHHRPWRGSPETRQADDVSLRPDIVTPSLRHSCLNGQAFAYRRWQYRLPIGLWLLLKELPARHAHHTRPDALLGQLLTGFSSQGHLRAAGDEDDVWHRPLGIEQDVRSPRQAISGAHLGT